MLAMKVVDYVESTNEKFYNEYCYEGQVISWRTSYSRADIIKRFNEDCAIGQRYVRETQKEQEELNYWLSHLDEYIKLHKHSFEVGDMDINNPIRKELNYYIKKVQLLEDDKVIQEEIFRYGR